MISLRLSLPWSTNWSTANLVSKWGQIGKNKGWEFELDYFHWSKLFAFEVNQSFRCDHAGFNIEIGLFGLNCSFRIYDARHWNYSEKRYYERGEYMA